MTRSLARLVTGALLALWWPAAPSALEGEAVTAWYRPRPPLGLSDPVIPADRPVTPARVALGRRLFHDPLLSADRQVSCASCHQPQRAFSDGRRVGLGVHGQRTTRNVPGLLNVALYWRLFWDGRAPDLESQVEEVLQSPTEMGVTPKLLVSRLLAEPAYRKAFSAAFGAAEISLRSVSLALAAYLRTLLAGDSPFDRYWVSGDPAELGDAAYRGLVLFSSRARCQACHEFFPHAFFTDNQFHNTGVNYGEDSGRYQISGREADRGRFRTPGLRNVALTAPYMHDGSLASLEAVIEHYARGGVDNPHRDKQLVPLRLSEEDKRDLIAFLEALTSSEFEAELLREDAQGAERMTRVSP